MKIDIKQLTNANIYLDGTNFLGRAEEVTLPEIKIKMAEHNALGLIGAIELPAGIEKLDGGKIKWASLYPEALGKVANPFKSYQLQIRGNLETYNSQGRTAEEPVVVMLTAAFKSLPLGGYKRAEKVDYETEFTATYLKMTAGSTDIVEVDLMANIWRAANEDLLANYRVNLGG